MPPQVHICNGLTRSVDIWDIATDISRAGHGGNRKVFAVHSPICMFAVYQYRLSDTQWRPLADTHLCPRSNTQTMSHIVESCPLTKLNGGLSRLHSADEDAVTWLTNYGLWHAYEKKKWHTAYGQFSVFSTRPHHSNSPAASLAACLSVCQVQADHVSLQNPTWLAPQYLVDDCQLVTASGRRQLRVSFNTDALGSANTPSLSLHHGMV